VVRASGGALFDLQIHDVDFCNWVLGKPTEIYTSVCTESYLATALMYPDGLTVCIEGGWFSSPLPYESFFMAEFEHGSLKYSRSEPGKILESDGKAVGQIEIDKHMSSYQGQLEHFHGLISGRERSGTCTAHSCLESVELCHRIRDSGLG
jgi:predicted dehydrogenase